MGRTGRLFAHQWEEVIPDIMTLSKALGGGLPLGAMLARGDVTESFEPGDHASTFGGNPVACAAALAMLETILADGFLEGVRESGSFFLEGLEHIAGSDGSAFEARGRGLLLGLELAVEAATVVEAALKGGYLTSTAQKKVLRFAPPFIITREEIAEFLKDLGRIVGELT
jgi:acetylornithine/N-succinyldiaminopimelate aminotransferase